MTTATRRRRPAAVLRCWAEDYEGSARGLATHLQMAVQYGKHPKEAPGPDAQSDEVRPLATALEAGIIAQPHTLPVLLGCPRWAAGIAATVWLILTLLVLGWSSVSGGLALLLAGPACSVGIWYLIARSRVAPVLILTTEVGSAVFCWKWWAIEDVLKLPGECRWVSRTGSIHVIDMIEKPIAFDPTPARSPEATSEDFGVAVEQTAIGGLVKAQTRKQEVMETIQAGVMFGMVGILLLANFLMLSRILDGPKSTP